MWPTYGCANGVGIDESGSYFPAANGMEHFRTIFCFWCLVHTSHIDPIRVAHTAKLKNKCHFFYDKIHWKITVHNTKVESVTNFFARFASSWIILYVYPSIVSRLSSSWYIFGLGLYFCGNKKSRYMKKNIHMKYVTRNHHTSLPNSYNVRLTIFLWSFVLEQPYGCLLLSK